MKMWPEDSIRYGLVAFISFSAGVLAGVWFSGHFIIDINISHSINLPQGLGLTIGGTQITPQGSE